MLSEIKTLKPAVLILWKTDRLGRDRYENRIKFSCHPQVIPHTRKTITVSINAIDPGKKLKVETKAGETFDFATAIPLNAEFGPVKNKGAADGLIYSGEEAIGEDGKLHIRGTAVKKGKVTIPFTVYGKKFKAVIKVKS